MTKEQISRLEAVLFKFVERAAEKGATAAEVQTLPAVANALIVLCGLN